MEVIKCPKCEGEIGECTVYKKGEPVHKILFCRNCKWEEVPNGKTDNSPDSDSVDSNSDRSNLETAAGLQ